MFEKGYDNNMILNILVAPWTILHTKALFGYLLYVFHFLNAWLTGVKYHKIKFFDILHDGYYYFFFFLFIFFFKLHIVIVFAQYPS